MVLCNFLKVNYKIISLFYKQKSIFRDKYILSIIIAMNLEVFVYIYMQLDINLNKYINNLRKTELHL